MEYTFKPDDEVFMDDALCLTFEVDSKIASNPHVVAYMENNPDIVLTQDDNYFVLIHHAELGHFIHMAYIHSDSEISVTFDGIDPYVNEDGLKLHRQYCYLIEH